MIVRITRKLFILALVGCTAWAPGAMAQDEKTDPLPPPKGAQYFGPRTNKPVVGGEPGQQRPQAETVSTHGAWAVQCSEVQAQDGQTAKSCGMTQQGRSAKNDKIGISVIVRSVKQGEKTAVFMQIMAPMGVFLPTGVPVEIDGTALPKPMAFSRCIPPICEATGEASTETLSKFRKGSVATFYVYDRPGNGFPIAISLEGFDAGLKALAKL